MAVVGAVYTGCGLLVYAARGPAAFFWFGLGGLALVLVVVTVEAVRSHE